MFLCVEGIDGVGKSTQVELLDEWLRGQGWAVTRCRDPGSTALGDALRRVLLDSQIAIHRVSETFLYMAARAQLVEEVIRPALAAGRVVLADRFLLSNVVYQGYAGELDPQQIWELGELCCRNCLPDLTLVLDMRPERALERLDRPLDRLESESLATISRRREGFLAEARRFPARIAIVDADRPPSVVQEELRRRFLAHWPSLETAAS